MSVLIVVFQDMRKKTGLKTEIRHKHFTWAHEDQAMQFLEEQTTKKTDVAVRLWVILHVIIMEMLMIREVKEDKSTIKHFMCFWITF